MKDLWSGSTNRNVPGAWCAHGPTYLGTGSSTGEIIALFPWRQKSADNFTDAIPVSGFVLPMTLTIRGVVICAKWTHGQYAGTLQNCSIALD